LEKAAICRVCQIHEGFRFTQPLERVAVAKIASPGLHNSTGTLTKSPRASWSGERSNLLVDLSVAEGKLTLNVRGADKLWAFKSSLEIPLVHVASVRADPEVARGWWRGIRAPGTNVPGLITAGTFYQDGKRVFWDVHHPEKTIVINLHDERFNQLVIEVADPDAAVKLVQNAL
jgi:hypothetical protein